MTQHVEAEVSRIKDAAQRVLAGESIWSIASAWNAEGVPTVTGRPWTVQTLTSILRSGRIAGLREHKGDVVGPGRWEAIIGRDLHDQLVVALATKRRVGDRVRTYPLVGLLRCGKCGGPLRSLARENGGRSYACRKGPGLDGCGGIRIQAQGVEAFVRDLVCGMLADPETRAALANVGDGEREGAGSLVKDLRVIETKRQHLIDLYTDGDIDRGSFRTRRDELDGRTRAIEGEMAQRSGRGALIDIPATFEELVESWDERGVEFQRRLTEAILHPITVRPAGTRRRLFDPARLDVDPRA